MNPEFQIRGLMVDPARLVERHAFYFDLLPMLAEWGYNTLWWHFCDDEGLALKLASCPELATPHAMDRREIEKLIHAAARVGIEVVPEVETLGHSLWITRHERFSHLFDGLPYGHNAICPSHPDTMKVLAPIIQEVAGLFPSAYFHAGLDEAVFSGCPRCNARGEGKPEGWVFARHVETIYETVNSCGKRMIMWADGVEKNPDLLQGLPKDIILAHWHYHREIEEKKITPSTEAGFQIIGVPAIQTVIQPAPDNLENINGMIDLAARLKGSGCLGVVASWWESFRILRDTVFPAIACAGQALQVGAPINWRAAASTFASGFFGIPEQDAETLWRSMSCPLSREEFLFLFADSMVDLKEIMDFSIAPGFDDRLRDAREALHDMQGARSKVTQNPEAFNAHILALRTVALALENASRLRDAWGLYRGVERPAGYRHPDEEMMGRLGNISTLICEVHADTAGLVRDVSREWDRTRHEDDGKKDNSSPLMRQRGRKAMLANMMRSERFFRRLAKKWEDGLEKYRCGGPFPGGI